MLSRTTLLALMVALGAAACAPPALDADHADNASASSSRGKSRSTDEEAEDEGEDEDEDETASEEDETSDPAPSNAGNGASNGAATPATFKAVYNALKGPCASCHLSGAAGAPVFFGDTEASSYEAMKNMAMNVDPSPLSTRGAHSGRALNADEDAKVKAWVAEDAQ